MQQLERTSTVRTAGRIDTVPTCLAAIANGQRIRSITAKTTGSKLPMTGSSKQFLMLLIVLMLALPAAAQSRSYRLPDVNLKQRVIWGATGSGPDGRRLIFGGQDQESDSGRPPTQIVTAGETEDIGPELERQNGLGELHATAGGLAAAQKQLAADARRLYFKGPSTESADMQRGKPADAEKSLVADGIKKFDRDLSARAAGTGYEAEQARYVKELTAAAAAQADRLADAVTAVVSAEVISEMGRLQVALEIAAEALAAEPPPRALSPLVYHQPSNCTLLFGGDHLDYLTNDLWVFDWSERRWFQRRPATAPPPRANHQLTVVDGKIALSGGYQYSNSTDYLGGQYRDWDDGEWSYDLATNTWAGDGAVPAGKRTYRSGPFHPDFFLAGPKPDPAAFQARLESLPANSWWSTHPPQLPQLNRDWGSATLDLNHDLILRFAGGHSAHGGSDVLHFHLASNRWELPFPVEFPLGQMYSNTSYPEGFNFNRRPWITGHSYQNYGYDSDVQKMFFAGRVRDCYVYDPLVADWTGRFAKPKAMIYADCFYTLTICPTAVGLFAWTAHGEVLRLDSAGRRWIEIEQRGGRLPGASVDNSTMVYDKRRARLLLARKDYGDRTKYDGEIHTLDPASGEVGKLSPQGSAGASAISYLCQMRYDSENDLLLVGATLAPDEKGERRTPAYDCAANRWVSLRIAGDDPSGPQGRNVSLGMMYDAKRKLFWAVDAKSNVFVLRLEVDTADMRPLD
jgi:hypothetical protein